MDSSTFATIFIVVLAVIFVFLVVMTIVMIATAGKKKSTKQKHDIHDDSKETKNLRQEQEDSIFAEAEKEADTTTEDTLTEDSAFATDSAFAADSAFAEPIGGDSAFAESAGEPTAYEEAAATGSAFAENIGLDSAFAENIIDDNTYVNNLEEDSDFDNNEESQEDEIPLEESYVDETSEEEAAASEVPEEAAPVKETVMTQAMVAATERTESELKNAIEEFLSESEPESEGDAAESDVMEIDAAEENHADEINLDEIGTDSAFGPEVTDTLSDEEITASVREALSAVRAVGAMGENADAMFGMSEELAKYGSKKKVHKKSTVASNEDFYWYNLLDVSEKPSYKTAEMYYHYFTIGSDCIDDLLMEMYDCALVRTEEIRYIAYGIPPKAVSMRDILTSGNSHYMEHEKKKEPTTQDMVRIYEKWCSYVDNLFEKIEIHADEFTINEIRTRLYEFGRNDVEVILEGR